MYDLKENPMVRLLTQSITVANRTMRAASRLVLIAAAGAVLGVAATPAAQGAELVVLETNAVSQAAYGDQYYGAVAAGPGEYFAVWVDMRVGGANPAGYDLYGQRILPDGSVANPGSIELLRDLTRTTNGIPAIAYNGEVYLVAWYEGLTLFGMRVAPDGEVLDPGGFTIGTINGNQTWPAIASDGQDFLVVQGGGSLILAHRVGGDGTVDPVSVVVNSGATAVGYPKVAFGAGVYTVVWTQTPAQAIRVARITPAGQLLDPGGINVSGGGIDVDPHVDFDGTNFYVVWQRKDGALWDLWGAHVNPGAELVSGPTLLLDGNTWGYVSSGQVAFNGTEHLITITTGEPVFSNSDLYAQRVSAAGAPIGSPLPVSTLEGRSQVAMGIAAVGNQFFIIWEGNYVSGVSFVYDTEGARVESGIVLDSPNPISVSRSAPWQTHSATSFDGENFLCVFEDWRTGAPSYAPTLYGVRVSPQGIPIDSSAFAVRTSGPGVPGNPDATFGGGQHVIVYENATNVNEVRLVRVLPDGTVLDPTGILIFANEPTAETFNPKVAFNGERYCVVWYDNYLFPGQQSLQFALVNVDGTIAYGPANVPNSNGASFDGFEIASNGDEFLIAWEGWLPSDDLAVMATRFGATGAFLGTTIVQVTFWSAERPQVAFNGESYLVAWRQSGSTGVRLDAMLLDQSGVPASHLLTVAGPGVDPDYAIAISTQGGDFLITASDRIGNELEVYSARIDASARLVEGPDVLRVMPVWETYGGSSAAMTPAGKLLMVYPLWAGNPYNAPRIQGELFDFGPPMPGDLDGDGVVGIIDFLMLLGAWGPCPPVNCPADLDGDGVVGIVDLLTLLANWS